MKKLIIFDLDGTLLNTIEDIRSCLNVVLERNGYKTIDAKETVSYLGYGAKALVNSASGKPDSETLERLFTEYVALQKNCDNSKTVLYDGLDGVLKTLKEKGYKLAIVSNKPDSVTQIVVEQKLSKYGFDFVTGNRPELFNPKPDKSCVEYCLNSLGIDKKDALFVGDSEVDVQTFMNAGIEGIGVLWGFRQKSVMQEKGCVHFANTADELLDKILNF